MYLKKFVIDNELYSEETIDDLEIDILLNEENFGNNKLKDYFKWLLSTHLDKIKVQFIKGTKGVLSNDNKAILKEYKFNEGDSKSVDEYFGQLYLLIKV